MVFCVFYLYQVFRFLKFIDILSLLLFLLPFPDIHTGDSIFLFLRVYVFGFICVTSFPRTFSAAEGCVGDFYGGSVGMKRLHSLTPAKAKCRSYSRSATPCILPSHG